MPASAIGCALNATISASATAAILKTVRVLADPGNDEALAVDPLDDRDDVDHQDRQPDEVHDQREEAADANRHAADDRDHDERHPQHDLGGHQHEPVLGVPLHFGVVLLHEERHHREHPQVGQHDHDAAIWRRIGQAARVYHPCHWRAKADIL